MTKKDKEEMAEFFGEAFREVVIPVLEDMNERMATMATKEDLDRIERKLDAGQKRMDRHSEVLERHERDIKQIKTKVSLI